MLFITIYGVTKVTERFQSHVSVFAILAIATILLIHGSKPSHNPALTLQGKLCTAEFALHKSCPSLFVTANNHMSVSETSSKLLSAAQHTVEEFLKQELLKTRS
jgi:hypothetical protein